MDEMRSLTKEELAAHYGDSLRQATREEMREWAQLKQRARREGILLPSDTSSFGSFGCFGFTLLGW